MNRRRFFPAQMTQTEPGKVVDLEVQLRPEAAAAPGGCECDVLGPTIAPDLIDPNGASPDQRPSYVSPSVFYLYGPRMAGWRCTGAYIQLPNEWDRPVRLHAVLIGATLCDVSWTWSLDVPPIVTPPEYAYENHWGGVDVRVENGALKIEVLPGLMNGDAPWWAELRISATCAGKPAGDLILRPGVNIWNPAVLPPIE